MHSNTVKKNHEMRIYSSKKARNANTFKKKKKKNMK